MTHHRSPVEMCYKFAVHFQKVVQTFDVFSDSCFGKVGLVRLNAKVFVDLLLFHLKESSDLFNPRKLLERLRKLQGVWRVLRVVSHEELSQVDARIEPIFDALVDFAFFRVNQSVDFAREFFEAWHQNGVDLVCQVNVEVLVGVGQINNV